jgi:hypothetical protein
MHSQNNIGTKISLTADAVTNNESPAFIVNPSTKLFSQGDRTAFYTGQERISLQRAQIERVRELQAQNDNLQRELSVREKELAHEVDPLSTVAEIEHIKIMIARNTGEILNIYAENEERLKRIAELEAKNYNLLQEKSDAQGQFIASHETEHRIKFASDFFHAKGHYEKNVSEISNLSKE